jgi:hypothetical protein
MDKKTRAAIRVESKERVAELYWRVLNMTRSEILDRVNESPTMFEECILFAILRDSEKGQTDTIDTMLNRVLGNPKDSIDIKANVESKNELDVSRLNKEELKNLLKLLEKGNAKT